VTIRESVNRALLSTTGYQLQKPGGAAAGRKSKRSDRLVEQPAFILSSIRSGSTLMRVLLNSHSQIHSPPELHLRKIRARARGRAVERALRELSLGEKDALRYLLWDRVLHRELQASGKSILVNKTPNDAFIVDRIAACWPDARFIYLLRHPAAIVRSREKARPQDPAERHVKVVLRYCNAVEEARRRYAGITVRYEDLASDPERETRRLCEFLEVPWEPEMLDYGRFDHGKFRPGLGDWSENIKSGNVRPPAPPPADTPPELVDVARAWGYLG
jgi:hypothetical protein